MNSEPGKKESDGQNVIFVLINIINNKKLMERTGRVSAQHLYDGGWDFVSSDS